MKAYSSLYAMLMAPVMLACAAMAQDKPGVLADYLPYDGSMLRGNSVRAVLDASYNAELQKVVDKLNNLSEEKKKEYLEKADPNTALDYNPDYWTNQDEYKKYLDAWNKLKVVALNEVLLGLQKTSQPGIWEVLSVTRVAQDRTNPLTISALKYDANRNVWISNNGELSPQDIAMTDRFCLGAQRGTEWTLKEESALSNLVETVRVTKSTDGKYVFVHYIFTESIPVSNVLIGQAAYVLRFPVVSAAASLSKPGEK